jgi:hypothetical protein
MDLLMRCFGGNKYIHGSGWTWMLSGRPEIKALTDDLVELVDPNSAVVQRLKELLL